MTPKIKDRWISAGVAALSGGVVAVLAFTLSSTEGRTIRINDKLDEKPNYEYVDKQDDAVKKIIYDYKTDHQIQHSTEFKSLDDKLDMIINHWNIKPVEDEGE